MIAIIISALRACFRMIYKYSAKLFVNFINKALVLRNSLDSSPYYLIRGIPCIKRAIMKIEYNNLYTHFILITLIVFL